MRLFSPFLTVTAISVLSAVLSGCASRQNSSRTAAPVQTSPSQPVSTTSSQATANTATTSLTSPILFTDITQKAGIKFKHNSGAFGAKLMPETFGSGVAFIDYNNDGYQDIFFVNGRYWTDEEVEQYRRGKWNYDERMAFKKFHLPGAVPVRHIPKLRSGGSTPCELYRNDGKGNFVNATRGSGLEVDMQGMGVTVGDYDNDGDADLYVTGWGRNYLFRNEGNGKFKEVAAQAGVLDSGWSTSAAWLDYDKDGLLDLFVCHYIQWTPETDLFTTMNWRDKAYSPPNLYLGELSRLFRNEGNGRFKDVSSKAQIRTRKPPGNAQADPLEGKSLGVAICDYNNDDWPDIIVANDEEPNHLFRNDKNGQFTEVAHSSGIALDQTGTKRAGMGVDTADIDHSNRDSAVFGNLDRQNIGLYLNQGNGAFFDIANNSEVANASYNFSVFGCVFLDVDNDGWPDLLTASGHIDPMVEGKHGTAYALRPLLFHNKGKGDYREIGLLSGKALHKPLVGRGLAYADIDLDGDLDVVITTNNAPAVLLRNDTPRLNNFVRLTLQGTKSNGNALGTLIKVKLSTKDGLRRWVRSGSSYLSQSEIPVTLGLGDHSKVSTISLRWPSGTVTQLREVAAGQHLTIVEGRGVTQRKMFSERPKQQDLDKNKE